MTSIQSKDGLCADAKIRVPRALLTVNVLRRCAIIALDFKTLNSSGSSISITALRDTHFFDCEVRKISDLAVISSLGMTSLPFRGL